MEWIWLSAWSQRKPGHAHHHSRTPLPFPLQRNGRRSSHSRAHEQGRSREMARRRSWRQDTVRKTIHRPPTKQPANPPQIAIQNTSGHHRVAGTRSRRTGRQIRPSWEQSCWALVLSCSRSAASWRSGIECRNQADSIQADSTWYLSVMVLDANTTTVGRNK
jgi:hypothetical protein